MNRIHTVMLSAMLVFVATRPALAQTADEIIDKYIAAVGGRAALSALKSRVSTGTLTVSSPIGDLGGTIEVYAKAPNKTRTIIKIDLSSVGAGQVINDQRFDGTAGYVVDSLNGNRDVTGEALEAMRNGSFPSPFLDYKERGVVATLSGEENVGGKPAYVITLTPKSGPVAKVFIERETSMLVKTSTTLNAAPLGTIEQVSEFSDFRDVAGLKMPYVTRTSNQVQTVVARLTDVKHNVEIDDSMFVRPPSQ
jgi:zinc protease